ncbi:hypothetical protein THAOC_29441, partial [Thalassiosira oceanica]
PSKAKKPKAQKTTWNRYCQSKQHSNTSQTQRRKSKEEEVEVAEEEEIPYGSPLLRCAHQTDDTPTNSPSSVRRPRAPRLSSHTATDSSGCGHQPSGSVLAFLIVSIS